jgi:hypothetical protein
MVQYFKYIRADEKLGHWIAVDCVWHATLPQKRSHGASVNGRVLKLRVQN